ncbi:D-arabinono-1,4-lactone oxidase [Actinocrispum sp. NPDC049592]|uniref:D-arabinono-1,4-lactone oxidase n=1 Tax=Actinocrispum sp. NPDC049592 TaxID=3154835 RepID=UPI0034266484
MAELNWARNVTYRAKTIHRPTEVGHLQELVARTPRIRALGTRHAFNKIADTTEDLVSVAGLPQVMEIENGRVRVTAGLKYADINPHLERYALPNLASLPHISVAGACATATHGSGTGSLSTAVSGLEIVTADGELRTIERGDPDFDGAVVNLGALGIVTAVTLDLVPYFEIRQYVYEGLSLTEDLLAILHSAYSVSFFTDWSSDRITQVWVKERTTDPHVDIPATPADGPRHPVAGMPAENCTQQMGVPGPWYARLPHFRPEFTPSAGDELQAEFMVAKENAVDALHAINEIRDQIHPVLHISEVRTIKADALWLSPFYHRDTVSIHFTLHSDADRVLPVIELIERRLRPFDPKPHWAKLFTRTCDYERGADFKALAARWDPEGKFGNEFTKQFIAVGN